MIKRIVVLQDESLVVQELARGPRQSLAQAPGAPAPQPSTGALTCPLPVAPLPPPHLPVSYGAPMGAPARGARGGRPGAASTSSGVAVLDEPAPPAVPEKPMPLGGGREERSGAGGAHRDRRGTAPRALEPPKGGRAARRELQDAAEQNQGVRHQP